MSIPVYDWSLQPYPARSPLGEKACVGDEPLRLASTDSSREYFRDMAAPYDTLTLAQYLGALRPGVDVDLAFMPANASQRKQGIYVMKTGATYTITLIGPQIAERKTQSLSEARRIVGDMPHDVPLTLETPAEIAQALYDTRIRGLKNPIKRGTTPVDAINSWALTS